jgi:hypothetical protein
LTELPRILSTAANDPERPATDRVVAVTQLVRNHVLPGRTTIGDLAALLEGADWLRDDDVALVTALAGKVPIAWSPDDTAVAILLPGRRDALYLAVAGRFSARQVIGALRGTPRSRRVLATIIRDIGFGPSEIDRGG